MILRYLERYDSVCSIIQLSWLVSRFFAF